MRVNGPVISRLDLAGARLPFVSRYFCMHEENCADNYSRINGDCYNCSIRLMAGQSR
jgi:hypothetical protein